MLRAMYPSISGLRNHQTILDVVGNNIANVNTYGFKASNVAFKTLLSQTTQGAGAPSPVLGGTNNSRSASA
ncbi:MAG: flgG [Thermoleophilia bacterium]|nr:flgG [Thermoleophilia bacterium]